MSNSEYSEEKLKYARKKAQGRDISGIAGETITTTAATAGGFAAAPSIAGIAGATSTTLFGSTTLGTILGVGTVVTPIGWIVGSAVAAGALGYGVCQLVKSGAKNDKIREDVIKDIDSRLHAQSSNSSHTFEQLEVAVKLATHKGCLGEEKGKQIISLAQSGSIPINIAIERVNLLFRKLENTTTVVNFISELNQNAVQNNFFGKFTGAKIISQLKSKKLDIGSAFEEMIKSTNVQNNHECSIEFLCSAYRIAAKYSLFDKQRSQKITPMIRDGKLNYDIAVKKLSMQIAQNPLGTSHEDKIKQKLGKFYS